MPKQTEKNRFRGNSVSNASAEFRQRKCKRIPFNNFKTESTAFSGNPQTIPLIFKKVEPKTFSENLGLPWRWEMI